MTLILAAEDSPSTDFCSAPTKAPHIFDIKNVQSHHHLRGKAIKIGKQLPLKGKREGEIGGGGRTVSTDQKYTESLISMKKINGAVVHWMLTRHSIFRKTTDSNIP